MDPSWWRMIPAIQDMMTRQYGSIWEHTLREGRIRDDNNHNNNDNNFELLQEVKGELLNRFKDGFGVAPGNPGRVQPQMIRGRVKGP